MSDGSRLRRFLNIERARSAAPDAEADAVTARRIGGLEQPGSGPGAPADSGADLDRFAPPPERPLELASPDDGERPFTRCMRCGMDHNVSVVECTGCGARLDTGPQLAFNEALWKTLRAESAREDAAAAELRERRAQAEAEAASARRALGETLAREVGEAERRRLDGELGTADAPWDALRRLLGRFLG